MQEKRFLKTGLFFVINIYIHITHKFEILFHL
jgi:hypothetical protein